MKNSEKRYSVAILQTGIGSFGLIVFSLTDKPMIGVAIGIFSFLGAIGSYLHSMVYLVIEELEKIEK